MHRRNRAFQVSAVAPFDAAYAAYEPAAPDLPIPCRTHVNSWEAAERIPRIPARRRSVMKSAKEMSVEQKLVQLTKELIELTPEKDQLPLKTVEMLINDEEVQAVQDYANNVSIVRLGFNDHGPVHMRTVCRNALKML